MNIDCMIISDFLDNPDKVRESLIEQKVDFFHKDQSGFPGSRTTIPDLNYQKMVDEKLEKVLPFKFKQDEETSTYCFQLCLEGDESWIHVDKTKWAGILYLTPNAPIESGTLIYTEDFDSVLRDVNEKVRETGDDSLYKQMKQEHEITTMIGNVYNRLLLIRGYSLPHRSNVGGFGDCLENGRLTQVFFFDEVE
tara:strand:- start:207 stop:788 length:582 start_codon:yes stop_codon:yes gene_type:complete